MGLNKLWSRLACKPNINVAFAVSIQIHDIHKHVPLCLLMRLLVLGCGKIAFDWAVKWFMRDTRINFR